MSATTAPGPPSYSPYDYAVHADPYPLYARLREEAPVYRNAAMDFWALSRHADVHTALRDPGRYSSANGVTLDPIAWGPDAAKTMSFLAMDPPQHTRMRSLVSKVFTPRRVADLTPRIRALTTHHLDRALEERSFDFVGDFSGKLPMDVICEMTGVPEADRTHVRRLADLLVHREEGLADVPPGGIEAALELAAYYTELLADRRRRPSPDDLTGALTEAEIDGDHLTDSDIIAFNFLLVVAGNETTAKLLANAMYWAWRNPGQREKPFADPGRVPDWVEETLRYDTSSQGLARTVTADTELHGEVVPAGARMLLLIGAANRDPRVFADPDRYDLDRDTSDMLSFGFGPHYCLGAALARLEARIALDAVVRRITSYELDEDGAERTHSPNVRGFSRLPIAVELR